MSSGQVQITGPCTLCIIKPHIIKELQAGNLLSSIVDAGFTIGAAFSFHFSKDIANELLDVYRQIYRPYSAMLDHLCSYPSLIIAVYGNDFVVEDFRQLCGPLNPEIARTLRPASLRARFGKDLAQNAVHCTDLVEDGEMECNYVFQTIASM